MENIDTAIGLAQYKILDAEVRRYGDNAEKVAIINAGLGVIANCTVSMDIYNKRGLKRMVGNYATILTLQLGVCAFYHKGLRSKVKSLLNK